MKFPDKIAFIGMPSSGKGTVGKELAEKLNYGFIDLDTMVEQKEGDSLINVMNTKGAEYFRSMEYDFLMEIKLDAKVVISPAGSIILKAEAIDWLSKNTFLIFLNTPFNVIEERLAIKPKAVFGLKDRGLKSIWDERMPLYKEYADLIVSTEGKGAEQITNEIIESFNENSSNLN